LLGREVSKLQQTRNHAHGRYNAGRLVCAAVAIGYNKADILSTLVAADQLSDIGFDVQLRKVERANYITDVYFGQRYNATPMSNSGGAGGPPDPNFFSTLVRSTTDIPGSGNNLSTEV